MSYSSIHDRLTDLRTLLADNGYAIAAQTVDKSGTYARVCEFYTGARQTVILWTMVPLVEGELAWRDIKHAEVFLPATTESTTAAEQDNLLHFFANGRPHIKGVVPVTESHLTKASEIARNGAWAAVNGGTRVQCQARDFEELTWLRAELTLNAAGEVIATDSEGFRWKVSAEDLMDPGQFRF